MYVLLMRFLPGFGPSIEDSLAREFASYHVRLPRRARTFAKVRKDTFVVSHKKPSPARADLPWPGYETLAFCLATIRCMKKRG